MSFVLCIYQKVGDALHVSDIPNLCVKSMIGVVGNQRLLLGIDDFCCEKSSPSIRKQLFLEDQYKTCYIEIIQNMLYKDNK